MAEEEKHHSIIHQEIHSDSSSHKTTFRFLKPCTNQPNKAVPILNTPLLSEIFPKNLTQWPSKVIFKGWRYPLRRWKEWVDRLSGKHSAVWKQTGILNAILSSLYVVPRNQDIVLTLSEFWSHETNTFVFPWGEATVTLEDTMILGGFPVLGEHTDVPLDEEMIMIERVLEKTRVEMWRSKAKKAQHTTWANHFMDQEGELEHSAFLSLWLSRFVFPSSSDVVGKNVFAIAVRLSRGTRVALAPAALASVYRDLRLLREGVMATEETIFVSGPFQLLQLWAFEHFSVLGPKHPNPLKPGEPRVARWHKVISEFNSVPLVRSALRDQWNFEWRPYTIDLSNWCHLAHYGETAKTLLSNDSSLDSELCSYFECLSTRELVGVDFREYYSPHRVAMQFGLDQDLPCERTGFEPVNENVEFFVPTRSSRGHASERYTKWFKDMMFTRDLTIRSVLKEEKYSKVFNTLFSTQAKSDPSIARIFTSNKEMDEFFESTDEEEQIFSFKKNTATPIVCESTEEEMSSYLSDDDNIPIGTLFNYQKSCDSETRVDAQQDFVSCISTKGMVDETIRKTIRVKSEGNSPYNPINIEDWV